MLSCKNIGHKKHTKNETNQIIIMYIDESNINKIQKLHCITKL